MSVLFLVLPVAVLLSALSVVAFAWAARRGQFDDLQTPALRMLHDEPPAAPPAAEAGKNSAPARRNRLTL